MYRKLVASACGLTMLSASAVADSTCDTGKLAGIIDGYATLPFSAATWRVLNGLGNPANDPSFKGVNRAVEYDWEAQETWKKLAAKILAPGQEPQQIGYGCRINYPLQILQERENKLGVDNTYVKQWITVQEQVLKACSDPNAASANIPDPLDVEPALAQLQKDDRAYQEASIAFYRDKPRAIELFRAIAAGNSPHRAAARYNIANLLANAKNIAEARKEASAILADQALTSVHGITQDLLGYIANIEDTPAGWTTLIDDSIATITAPKTDILSSPKKQDNYMRSLDDVDHLGIRAKTENWWLLGTLPLDATVSKAIFDASRKYPMVLWMMAGQTLQQNYDGAPWSLVGEKWQRRATSYLDQVTAVAPSGAQIPALPLDVLNALRAKPDDATREALWGKVHAAMAATLQSCGEAPETAALGTYLSQAVRISAATGHFDEAYDELAKIPFKTSVFYLNGALAKLTEYVLGWGMAKEGRNLRDRLLTPDLFAGLPDNMRPGVTDKLAEFMGWVAEDEAHWKRALALHSAKTGNAIFNFLPVKTLTAYADDPMFLASQKALLSRVVWTRTYALGQTPSEDLTAKLYAANPKIKAVADKVATDYPKASPERQRLLTILRSPRMGVLVNAPDRWTPLEETGDDWADVASGDHNDRNWWCPLETDRQLAGLRAQLKGSANLVDATDYGFNSLKLIFDQALRDSLSAKTEALLKQHPMIMNVSWKEVSRLSQMPGAPQALAQSALRWGKAAKAGDGAAEALALAVRVTHYGCNWHGRVGPYSRPAQQLLKTRFGSSTWAAQTPYWFDCQRMEWDKDYNKVAVCDAKSWSKQAPLR